MSTEVSPESAYEWLRVSNVALGVLSVLVFAFWDFLVIYSFAWVVLPFKRAESAIVVGKYVPRSGLDRLLNEALKDKRSFTVMVYGARSSGKSTLIKKNLQLRWAVLEVNIEPGDNISEKIALKSGMSRIKKDLANQDSLISMFRSCPIQRPVVILSLNNKATKETIDAVVSYAKTVSFDVRSTYGKGEATVIIDLSSYRPAFSAGITQQSSRVIPLKIGPFETIEASNYLDDHLPSKEKKWSATVKADIREAIIEVLDLHVNHLMAICKDLERKPCPDLNAAKLIIKCYATKQEAAKFSSWKYIKLALTEYIVKWDVSKEQAAKAIQCLVSLFVEKQSLTLRALNNELKDLVGIGVSEQQFATWNSDSGGTHVFDVDHFTHRISVNGKFALNALRRAKEKDESRRSK